MTNMSTPPADQARLVSVLLASYNHAPYVEAAVRSVIGMQGIAVEFLAIDDGSTDGSADILQRLSAELGFELRIRENRGLVATLNELVAMSHGKYICTLASDDMMPPGRLARQVAWMEAHPEQVASFGQVRQMDATGNIAATQDVRYRSAIPQATFAQLLQGLVELNGCTEMLRRDALMAVGCYTDRFAFEDYPLWLALSHRYGPLAVLPEDHCYYRLHGKNMSRRIDFIYTEVLRIIADYRGEAEYARAHRLWKANWFSSLAYADKWLAFRRLPELFSWSWPFIRRIPKLFIPAGFLKQ